MLTCKAGELFGGPPPATVEITCWPWTMDEPLSRSTQTKSFLEHGSDLLCKLRFRPEPMFNVSFGRLGRLPTKWKGLLLSFSESKGLSKPR